ncbi:MAG: hypothetical protein R2770_06815 [Acidimicrobiales bacterium]
MASTPVSETRRNEKIKRRRAAVLGTFAGIALFVLALGVFSVGQASRRVTERASSAHSYDELLMSATVARAQLSFTSLVYELGQTAEIDVARPIESNLGNVSGSMTNMAVIVEEARRDGVGLLPTTEDSVGRFRERVREVSLALSNGEDGISLDAMEQAYDELADVVARDRDDALDLLDAADAELTDLGTLVGAIIAFLIPTVAVMIYRELTRPQREVLELEAALAKGHAQTLVRRKLVDRFVERARMRPESHLTAPIERFVAATEVVDGARAPDLQTLESGELSSMLWRAGRVTGVEVEVSGPTGIVTMTDGGVFFDAVRLLIRDLAGSGASLVFCEIIDLASAVELRLGHDGVRRTSTEAALALEPDSSNLLDIVRSKRSADLWVARTLLRAIGADLRAVSKNPSVSYAVVVPRVATESTKQRQGAVATR